MLRSDNVSTESTLPVSVVVLAYNSARYLDVCLTEASRARGVELEIIVVDNASADNSVEIAKQHPSAPKVIEAGRNLGCAGGNNLGWKAARHPYIIFLNPDCAPEPDAFYALVEPLATNPQIGMTGARLYYPNSRRIQHAGGILHPNAMAEHPGVGEEDRGQFNEDRDVDFVTGALIAVRRADLEALGGMDEEYFPAYYEETDLCARLRASGRRIRYVASAIGYHWESVELGRLSPALVRMSYRSRVRFLIKNCGLWKLLAVVLPFELKWFFGRFARGYRLAVLRSYGSGALFALRCLTRLRRRPRGVQSRLDSHS